MVADPITTIFVAITILLAKQTEQARRQQEAVAAIHTIGGSVFYDYQRSGESTPNVFNPRAEPRVPQSFRRLFGEDYFRAVVMVSLRDTDVTDEDLQRLKNLPYLDNVDLSNTGISSAGIEHLRGNTNLRCLSLWRTQVDDEGLKHLKGMTKMWSLSLDDTFVTNAGLKHLEGLTDLEEWLGLSNLLVSDEG
jgi:hypothetical protein